MRSRRCTFGVRLIHRAVLARIQTDGQHKFLSHPTPLRHRKVFTLDDLERNCRRRHNSSGESRELDGNVRQPNHVFADTIGGNKAELWPWAGKEWLAATKHNGMEVESILIDKTKVG